MEFFKKIVGNRIYLLEIKNLEAWDMVLKLLIYY